MKTFDEWYDDQGYSTNRKSNHRSVAKKSWNKAMDLCIRLCLERSTKGGYMAHMTEAKRCAVALTKLKEQTNGND